MFLVAELTVHDAAKLRRYAADVRPVMRLHGGRILAMSRGPLAVEGRWAPDVLVVHRWESRDAFDVFWHCAAYAPLKRLREEACDARIVTLEDWPPAGEFG